MRSLLTIVSFASAAKALALPQEELATSSVVPCEVRKPSHMDHLVRRVTWLTLKFYRHQVPPAYTWTAIIEETSLVSFKSEVYTLPLLIFVQ